MSVAIATDGLFRTCCFKGGGGAPSLSQNVQREEEPLCTVDVIRVYLEDVASLPDVTIDMRGGVKFK